MATPDQQPRQDESRLESGMHKIGDALNAGWATVLEQWDEHGRPVANKVEKQVGKGVRRAEQGGIKLLLGTLDKMGDLADGISYLTRRPREIVKVTVPVVAMSLDLMGQHWPAVILAGAQQATHLGGGLARSVRTWNWLPVLFAIGEAMPGAAMGLATQSPEVTALTFAASSQVSNMVDHEMDAREFHLVPAQPRPQKSATRRK